MRNLFLRYGELFTLAAAIITAVALVFSIGYEDGIAAVAHAQRGLILRHHEAEHHLQANQQRMEVPNDGGFVQQCDPVGRRNAAECRNTILRVNRAAKLAMDVFQDILDKEALERNDLELVIKKIRAYEDHLEIELRPDIDQLIRCESLEAAVNFEQGSMDILKTELVQSSVHRKDKVYTVNVISDGDPSYITFTSEDQFQRAITNIYIWCRDRGLCE